MRGDHVLMNPNDGGGAFTSPVREVWWSIDEWQSDRAIAKLSSWNKRTTSHNGRGSFLTPAEVAAHSALISAALMIGRHFSMSVFYIAPRASGVCRSRGKFPSRGQ
jgi:hypothetical protein